MDNQVKYELYVGKLQNVPSEIKYSFYNADNEYILIYTDKKPTDGDFRIVPTDLLDQLSPSEKNWLGSVKLAINTEYIKQNSDKFRDILNDYAVELEKQLKIEKEKVDRIKNEQTEKKSSNK